MRMSLADFWDIQRPAVKRIKREERCLQPSRPQGASGARSKYNGDEDAEGTSSTSLVDPDDIGPLPVIIVASVDDKNGMEPQLESGRTELESSLLPVKTDPEAIEQYEAIRAAATGTTVAALLKVQEEEQQEPSIRERLETRKWQKGRSSINVDAFNLALETVLDEEAHLFDEAEREVFRHWQELPYESQYLYVRLFLRKTAAWHRISRLGYYQDIADLPRAVDDLRRARSLPGPSTAASDPAQSEDVVLSDSIAFAEGIEEITTLEEASTLLLLEELKELAKEAKISGKNKKELLAALRQSSQTQTGLGRNSKDGKLQSQKENRDAHFLRKILDHTGDCIRLSAAPLKLFERVHLVFYRSTEWTEKSLTTIILAKISRKIFPDYVVSRSTAIFPTRAALLEFEAALRTQFQVDNLLESNGAPTTERLQAVKDLCEGVYPRWEALLEQEQRREERVYQSGEGAYLRRFSPAWVYTRIIHKGLHSLGRFREHKREHEVLTELLDQRLFHAARRGYWYQRKALLEEHYMPSMTSSDGRSEDVWKKHWKKVALRTCESGLQDPDCHVIYHYDLQKRIMKLEKSLRVVKREQHDFGYAILIKPEERVVHGIRVEKDDTSNGNASRTNADTLSRRGRPTVWLDEREGGGECRVENMCLSWYRDNGWKGYHSEGGIVRTLFGYLFYDVLFTYVPNVFQTPFQTCPLDLHTDAFYMSRASEINHRLVQIANGEAERIIREVHDRESPKQTCVVGIDWSFSLDDLVEIVQCFRGESLATVCKVMAQEYRQRGGGIPDLFLWNIGTGEVMFSEVKSENDCLSDTQRLWIHVLMGAGIRVELCNAVAREVRYMSYR